MAVAGPTRRLSATTVEAFIACFAEASGSDLTAFFGWYEQAGTPRVAISTAYDAAAQALDLTLEKVLTVLILPPQDEPIFVKMMQKELGLNSMQNRIAEHL